MSDAANVLSSIELDEGKYIALLTKLIGESEKVQNAPQLGLLPQEDLIVQHVVNELDAYKDVIKIEKHTFVEGRSNLILTYPAADASGEKSTVAFVGSHMDVVPATPESWEFDPFTLKRDGDKLLGRGTTDCLGHVALLTRLLATLAEKKPALKADVVVVFIASEEAESVPPNAGVESLVSNGLLAHLKNGPVLWVDSADSQPCIGTAGALQWHLKAVGHLFHSGLPHRGINSLELGMEAIKKIQERFYQDFPKHEREDEYNFSTPSTIKPTQVTCSKNSLNQIPPHCTISGDIRLTPFWDVKTVEKTVEGYVADLNKEITSLPTRGPCSKYEIPKPDSENETIRGRLEWTWAETSLSGIACNLKSPGYAAILKASEEVLGDAKPYSICGSLPLVREMQEEGFDIQIVGYGLSSVYHGDNEYCSLTDMKNGFKICSRFIRELAC